MSGCAWAGTLDRRRSNRNLLGWLHLGLGLAITARDQDPATRPAGSAQEFRFRQVLALFQHQQIEVIPVGRGIAELFVGGDGCGRGRHQVGVLGQAGGQRIGDAVQASCPLPCEGQLPLLIL
jgi:hypothetical protein